MPYLKVSSNIAVNQAQSEKILVELSELLAKQTGKPEKYVLVELIHNQAMRFAGSDKPLAYLECKSIGLTTAQAKNLAATLSQVLTASLGISAERIYIEFSNCPAEFWGWNGSTFA